MPNDLHGYFVDIGLLIMNTSASDYFEFPIFSPRSAHVYKHGLVIKKIFQFVNVLVCHPLPFVFGQFNDFLFCAGILREGLRCDQGK